MVAEFLVIEPAVSVHGGGGMSAPLHAGINTTPGMYTHTPPRHVHRTRAGTPPQAGTPPVQCMLGYGQQAGGTHPTGMYSCFCNADIHLTVRFQEHKTVNTSV